MYSDTLANSYRNLVDGFKNSTLDQSSLNQLKDKLNSVINSPRSRDNINTLSGLIEILEKRDDLGPSNIDHLYLIVENPQLSHHRSQLMNHAKQINNFVYRNPQELPCNHNMGNPMPQHTLPVKGIEMLSKELKNSWKVFSRKIGIDDWNIEVIDGMDMSTEKKIATILDIYVENNDGVSKRGNILNALASIRRNDVKNKLQSLFMEPCIKCSLGSNVEPAHDNH